MTQIVTYQCNLCRTCKPAEQMIGIRFSGERGVEKKHPCDVHSHICDSCWTGLQSIIAEERAK